MSNPDASDTRPDGSRTYLYPPTGEAFPSVTTILGATEGKPWLTGWSARIAAEYAVDNLPALAALKAKKGRDEAVALAAEQAERIRDLKRDTGGYVHDVIKSLVLWQASPAGTGAELALPLLPDDLKGMDYDEIPVEEVAEVMLDGFLNFVTDFRPVWEASEMTVYNPALRYAGTLDAITHLPGLAVGRSGRFIPGTGVTPCVDFKTGKYLDESMPEQIAAYRRATVARMPLGDLITMPPTECGCVVHLRPEYERGYRLILISNEDDAKAWNRFRRAVELFEGRKAAKAKPGKVCYPLRPDGTIPQPRIADLDGEGYGRVLSPLMRAGIEDLEQLAAMTEGQCRQVKGIGAKSIDIIRLMLADHGLSLAGETAPQGEAALWQCWTCSARGSRSAGSGSVSRWPSSGTARTPVRRGPRSWTPSGSPPGHGCRRRRSPPCTGVRSASGAANGRS